MIDDSLLIQANNFELPQTELLTRMLVATTVGFLLGLEREHDAIEKKEEQFAGIRTFIIVVLLGFWLSFASSFFSNWILLIGLIGLIGLIWISYFNSSRKGQIGGTTEFALLLAFLLGSMIFIGHIEISLALTVLLMAVLSLKVRLQIIIGRITQDEIYALVKFVVVALLIIPFLPDRSLGPYDVINPREIGWIIVLTSGIGFAGYLLIKFLGSGKGILWTGIVGGLVSSTVVTWIFSKKSKEVEILSPSCAVAILAASTIMVLRVIVWVYIFNRNLLWDLMFPLVLLLLAGLAAAWFLHRKQESFIESKPSNLTLGNPLNLRDAVVFGILYGGILLLVSYANTEFGTKGIYLSSGIAALTDIDAITISVSKLGGASISEGIAQKAILLATLCNTLVKIGLALWFGSRSLRRYVLFGFGMMFMAGTLGFLLLNI